MAPARAQRPGKGRSLNLAIPVCRILTDTTGMDTKLSLSEGREQRESQGLQDTGGHVRLGVCLASGESFSFVVRHVPPCWKSWLMRRVPYGSDLASASFWRESA